MHMSLKVFQAAVVTTGMLWGSATAIAADAKVSRAKAKIAKTADAANEDVKESILNGRIHVALLKSLNGADALRVSVKVAGTTAYLSGEVEDRGTEKLALEVAKSIEGVTTVHSSITQSPKAEVQENFEARVKDSVMVTEVRLRLLQEVGTHAMGLHITSTDGVVSLRGNMPNATTRTRAVDNVKELSGVTRVEDLMTTTK